MFCSPMPRSCHHHSGSTIYRRFVYSVTHFRPTACNNKLPHVRESKTVSQSTSRIRDSSYWIAVFVSRTFIPVSNRQWDSDFLELYSGFQSPGFRIPQAKFSLITESGFPQYMGRNEKNIYIIIRFYIFCFAVKPYFGLQLSIASFFCQVAITFYQSGTEDRLRTILQPKQSGNKKCLVF